MSGMNTEKTPNLVVLGISATWNSRKVTADRWVDPPDETSDPSGSSGLRCCCWTRIGHPLALCVVRALLELTVSLFWLKYSGTRCQ